MHARIASFELDLDRSKAEIGAHSEISNSSDHRNERRDIVKDAVRARLGEGQADEAECRNRHHGAYGLMLLDWMATRCRLGVIPSRNQNHGS